MLSPYPQFSIRRWRIYQHDVNRLNPFPRFQQALADYLVRVGEVGGPKFRYAPGSQVFTPQICGLTTFHEFS
jgi:hypothetical protein